MDDFKSFKAAHGWISDGYAAGSLPLHNKGQSLSHNKATRLLLSQAQYRIAGISLPFDDFRLPRARRGLDDR